MEDLIVRAEQFVESKGSGIQLTYQLGFGNDGRVWATDQATAVKVFEREPNYTRERNCYQRLHEASVRTIEGFAIPRLFSFDDNLCVIEIGVVSPPYIIDFAKSYLDRPPDFPPEVVADWETSTQEMFGEKWPVVQSILVSLRLHGIHYFDAKPGNIRFADEE